MAERKTNPVPGDAELVAAALSSGGREAFGELVKRYKGMVMGRTYAILGDWHEAEDLAQDAFVRAYRSLGTLREPSGFAAWLGRIAANVALSARKKRRPASLEAVAASGGGDGMVDRLVPARDDADPGESASRDELFRKALEGIESLPEEYRSTVYLRYLKGRTCSEIAAIEGVTVGAVTSRLSRSAAMLRDKLSPLTRGEA